jgi:3-hydroxybutyryl-CoA dehydrogenase
VAPLDRSIPVGVVGAGTMGAGIAQVAAVAGHPVRVLDALPGVAERSVVGIGQRLARLVAKGRLTAAAADQAGARLAAVGSTADLAGCGLVVEAAVEDLAVKRELFAELEKTCGDRAILTTNTSSLSVTDIAEGLVEPARVAGLHFFNPAPVLPLVEVVAGAASSEAVLRTLADTARAWGKTPVRCASTPGFIVNRVARPYYAEAFRLLEAGVSDPSTLDALLREAGGFPMGPFELTDLIGQDVNSAVTRSVWEAFDHDPRFEPSTLQESLVADGRLGRKSGRGFYGSDERPDPATAPAASPPRGVVVNGSGGPLDGLVRRLASARVPVTAGRDLGPVRLHPADDVMIRLTDGRTAAAVTALSTATVILLDLALDFATATRVAISAPDHAPPGAVEAAVGCLQAAGLAVTVLPDVAGLVVARTVAMIAAFGADAVDAGVASEDDVDTAMRLGVNYPRGPIEWGDRLGWGWVTDMLDALAAAEDPRRYRVSDGLRERADHGAPSA